jgi:hypothetical protein
MNSVRRFIIATIMMVAVIFFYGNVKAADSTGYKSVHDPIADVMIGSQGISWIPRISYGELELRVALPNGSVFNKTFKGGAAPNLSLSDLFTDGECDGVYTYELRLIPENGQKRNGIRTLQTETRHQVPTVQNGYFSVVNGSIVTPNVREDMSRTQDVLHYDDVIITGSLCIGFDCANGESFGYCTLKLKENNLQFCFEDTSTGSFPTNDWKIQINDTTSGGASYFTLWDTDGGRRPFTIEAGAPAHSLYVEDYGRVGLGTSIPYVELHIVDGDSPTIRLDQDGSSGWAAQRWDLCGNETNFFIRDVTNGSKLCMRIQPNTPSNTLCMRSTGFVGIGTWSPEYCLEVEKTGAAAEVVAQRTDGATVEMTAADVAALIGTKTNHPMRFRVNNVKIMELAGSGNYIEMIGGGTYNGTWNPSSSRELKENIHDLGANEALKALEELNPVKYNYKKNKKEDRVGFIAEDVPDLVSMQGRKTLGTVDIVAVLTKVVKEQQKTIAELKAKVEKLEKK